MKNPSIPKAFMATFANPFVWAIWVTAYNLSASM